MARGIRIVAFEWDELNERKVWAHGLTAEQFDQVLGNLHVAARNRRGRRAPRLVIGRDNGGQCITIAVEPTGDPLTWRPITAWYCKESERRRLEREE